MPETVGVPHGVCTANSDSRLVPELRSVDCAGLEELPEYPDCSRWVIRKIEVNEIEYDVIRRPRLFRYAALRHFQDPDYIDHGELADGGDPEDAEHQNLIHESKLWCLDFDIDFLGVRKALRVTLLWPPNAPSYAEICEANGCFPQGIKTFLGCFIFPVTVRMDMAAPADCDLRLGCGGWTVKEIRFVEYAEAPFGMLEDDRVAAEGSAAPPAGAIGGCRSPRGIAHRTNRSYDPRKRDQLYDAWIRAKHGGCTRYKSFLRDNAELCTGLNIRTVADLKRTIDSERKSR